MVVQQLKTFALKYVVMAVTTVIPISVMMEILSMEMAVVLLALLRQVGPVLEDPLMAQTSVGGLYPELLMRS